MESRRVVTYWAFFFFLIVLFECWLAGQTNSDHVEVIWIKHMFWLVYCHSMLSIEHGWHLVNLICGLWIEAHAVKLPHRKWKKTNILFISKHRKMEQRKLDNLAYFWKIRTLTFKEKGIFSIFHKPNRVTCYLP